MTNSKSFLTPGQFMAHAIQFELDSVDFYKGLLERVNQGDSPNDIMVRELVLMLIKEEAEHAVTLKDLETGTDSMLQFPPELSLSMPHVGQENLTLEELIKIALEREQKSQQIYEEASRLVKGSVKELLESLAAFEAQHVENILKMQSYLF